MPSNRFLLLLIAGVVLALPASARTLKIATVVPEGSAWVKEMRTVGKEIEQKTQGRVRFKFYPGGVMGNDKTVLRKVRAGQLQGGAFTSGALAQVPPYILACNLRQVLDKQCFGLSTCHSDREPHG